MYVCLLEGYLNDEFVAGVEEFVEFCESMEDFDRNGKMIRCPCRK